MPRHATPPDVPNGTELRELRAVVAAMTEGINRMMRVDVTTPTAADAIRVAVDQLAERRTHAMRTIESLSAGGVVDLTPSEMNAIWFGRDDSARSSYCERTGQPEDVAARVVADYRAACGGSCRPVVSAMT